VIDDHWHGPQGMNLLTVDVNPRLLLRACEAIGSSDSVQLTFDLRSFREYETKVLSKEEKKKMKGKRRRWYSGAFKVAARVKPEEHQAVAYVMPMTPYGTGVDESGGAFRG
jgi:hypothetical protein